MATLYLARRHGIAGFSRLVALKMVQPQLAGQPVFTEMFIDEARICSQISHPNIVHVEEFGVIDGIHYLVMEYLDGCSVGELVQLLQRRGEALDPELAARTIMQIAGGLHAAHEARDQDGRPLDIVHRDISPSNMVVCTDGNAKLIDFGIAKAQNRLSAIHADVRLKGKFNYVAPEQATGAAVDRRCDIFSLGIVFWEMLVGRPLFPEDTYPALCRRLRRTDVVPPSVADPEVPAVFDSIVMAMLQHDPANRPRTAAEVQRQIASAAPGAANRDASEFGALVGEVRDWRTAMQRADGAGTGSAGHIRFSSTPRSMRPPSSGPRAEVDVDVDLDLDVDLDVDLEIEAAPGADVPRPAMTEPPATPRWTRRRVRLGVVGLISLGLAAAIAIGSRVGHAKATAQPAPPAGRQRELVEPAPAAPSPTARPVEPAG